MDTITLVALILSALALGVLVYSVWRSRGRLSGDRHRLEDGNVDDRIRAMRMEDFLRARGLDPKLVRFGRLVPHDDDPLQLTVEEFRRAEIGGRALDLADCWFAGLQQQHRRLREPRPVEDATLSDMLAHLADAELTLVLLMRLRRAANLIRKHAEGCGRLEVAIRAFDKSVPHLQHLRDTHEHFDDYTIGRGRQRPKQGVSRAYIIGDGAPQIHRGQRMVDLEKAIKAARKLYTEMHRVAAGKPPALLKREQDPLPPRGGKPALVYVSSPFYWWSEKDDRWWAA